MRVWSALLFMVTLILATPSQAHIHRIVRYDELFEKSDLIVIAEPVTKTTDTAEHTFMPGLVAQTGNGPVHPIPAIGVETVFSVCKVVKGDPSLAKFTLHHLREAPVDPSIISVGGAPLMEFEPSLRNCNGGYLLFLVKEPDGRYGPYDGPTDASGTSVFKLDYVP